MKKQLMVIHGASAFSDYSAFLDYLKTCPLDDPLSEKPRRWKSKLADELGEDYEVYQPQMPNSQNARYVEWKIWFERHLGFLRDRAILLGHSQGGYFLAKYLTENAMPVTVKALYLVASPFESDNFEGEDGGDFAFNTADLPNIAKNIGKIHILHSKDDPVVPYEHALKFKKALPEAELVTFEDKEHFSTEEFPELVEMIRSEG